MGLMLILALLSISFAAGDVNFANAQASIAAKGDIQKFLPGYSVLAVLGILINLLVNVGRYMLSKFAGDEQTTAKTMASVLNSVGVALFIGGIFIILAFVEAVIPLMFGQSAGSYSDFLGRIDSNLEDMQLKLENVISVSQGALGKEYSRMSDSMGLFGITLYGSGCAFGDETCIGNIQQKIAEYVAVIETAFDVELAVIVARAAFEFFTGPGYNAAGFLLAAGLAYYSLDATRGAGAALIALALGAYYVYPVAYEAFLTLPSFPDVGGGQQSLADIQSLKWCSISTVPSVYLTRSDASVSFSIEATRAAGTTDFNISSGELLSFLRSLYISFLLRHGVALSVTLLFIYHSYLILSGGTLGSMMVSRLGGVV